MLDKKRLARKNALDSSRRLMKKDEKGFDDFLSQNKQETVQASNEADLKFEERKKLEKDIKKLITNQNGYTSENIRIDELCSSYQIYKEFLDDITTEDPEFS